MNKPFKIASILLWLAFFIILIIVAFFSTNSCKQRNVTNCVYSLSYKYVSSVE